MNHHFIVDLLLLAAGAVCIGIHRRSPIVAAGILFVGGAFLAWPQ